ncbi:hypothetical protein [Pleurocapsa sp. PCC 7319]|uniref:hypothetical protein n=1 Tax=Pleurocapsa sp. PCC 7319 TaxID=118161 RepID=UPI00034DB65A|nr:hypothetical protein [Pleurocapsa sp. PCC 7319]
MKSLPIEYKFESERFRRYIQDNPQQAHEYAISHFEDYLAVLHEYRLLQAKHDQLQNELIKLNSRKSPQLPSFLSSKRK